jgi:hypothetical protein
MYIKIITITIVGILLFTSLVPKAIALPEEKLRLWDRLFTKYFELLAGQFGTKFFVLRFSEPQTFIAEPNIIDIRYLNDTKIIIGVKDPDTGDYISLQHDSFSFGKYEELFFHEEYEFTLELPEDIPQAAFIGHFDPQSRIPLVEKGQLKTTLQISSNVPNTQLPESILLRVNITKYTTSGNLYFPPGGKIPRPLLGHFPYQWFIMALLTFGRLYSGKRLLEEVTYLDIMIKLDRFHLLDIIPPQNIEIRPDELVSIPIEVKNLGSHIDTFNFRIKDFHNSDIIVTPPPALTLGPNEVASTTVTVASPQIFNDPGTARKINVEAYSIYDPETTFNNTVTIITRGVYLSDIGLFYSGSFGIFILLIFVGLYFLRRRKKEVVCKKPEKPWTITEEIKYLEELKKKDRKTFEKERLMMEDEYKSAILWYKYYCNDLRQKEKKQMLKLIGNKENKQKKEKLKTVNKQKEPRQNKLTDLFKKLKIKKVRKPKEEKPLLKIEPKSHKKQEKIDDDQKKKEQVLLRIKREQKRQMRLIKRMDNSS